MSCCNNQLIMFDRDFEDYSYQELPHLDFKAHNNTHCATRLCTSSLPSSPEINDQSFDLSLDRHLFKANAHLLKRGALDYLQHCLGKEFKDVSQLSGSSLSFNLLLQQEENLSSLVHASSLLPTHAKKQMIRHFEQSAELLGLFEEVWEVAGRQLTEQLLVVTSRLLQAKLPAFGELLRQNEEFVIPKMERFLGDQGQERPFLGGWQVYEQIDYETIKEFASSDLEHHASHLYFSGKLHFLNLESMGEDISTETNMIDKFTALLGHFSRNIFFTLSGMTQKEEQMWQLRREMSLKDGRVEGSPGKKVKINQ